MVPRGTLDIGWGDLAVGLLRAVWPGDGAAAALKDLRLWSDDDSLVTLSVRSGFDLVLRDLALPPASEVLMSAVTIPDMLRILAHHRLVAVPIDIDSATLAVDQGQLASAVNPRTRALVVAHLFGSRMPLEPIVDLARRHNLTVIEDCAQAFDGSYTGHAESDVCLFSFGPIKTATALGGAVARVRDRARLARMRAMQEEYPRQTRRAFVGRILRFSLLKALSRPSLYGTLVALCRWCGIDHDRLIAGAARGFPGAGPLGRFRLRPSAPLVYLLTRRLRQAHAARIAERVAYARRIVAELPAGRVPGLAAARHAHWVLPFASRDPEGLVHLLWEHGFDATRKSSSLVIVPSVTEHPECDPQQARGMLGRLVYLPMVPTISDRAIRRLGQLIRTFEALNAEAPFAEEEMADSGPAEGVSAETAGRAPLSSHGGTRRTQAVDD